MNKATAGIVFLFLAMLSSGLAYASHGSKIFTEFCLLTLVALILALTGGVFLVKGLFESRKDT